MLGPKLARAVLKVTIVSVSQSRPYHIRTSTGSGPLLSMR